MPESAEAARKRLAYEAARRRQAVATLRLAEAVARYAADQVGNGLGPQAARQATVEAAGELAELAAVLRRLALARPDLDTAGRRALAVQLAADGLSQRQAARVLGVSKKTVWTYLRPGRGPGNP